MQQEELTLEVKEHRESQREAIIYKVLRATMAALSARGLRYLALLITAGLYAWAMWEPTGMRTINAGLFSLVFVVVLNRKDGGDGE